MSLPIYSESYRPSADWAKKLDEKKAALGGRAFPALAPDFLAEWTFGTLHVEFPDLEPAEITAALADSDGRLAEDARRFAAAAERLVARAHAVPADERDHLTPDDCFEFYCAVTGESPEARVEMYRAGEGEPQVESHQPAIPEALPLLLEHTLDWFATDSFAELHPVEQVALFHLRMRDLQPFAKCNNRIVRLMMSFYTLRAGLPPVVLIPEAEQNDRDAFGYAIQMITQPSLEVFAFLLQRAFDRFAKEDVQ